MTKLHFNYKDVFRALRLAFSAKKLAMMMWGWFLAMIGYIAFTYIAFMSAGWTFIDTWQIYKIFPIPDTLAWYGWIIWFVGVIYALIVFLITGTAIAKVTYEQLKGDDFFQMTKAFKYATERMKSVVMSPFLVGLFIAAIAVCGLILSLIGKIPYFGELFTGIMIIPAFVASLFIVYLLIILLFSVLFTPAIVGTTGNDTFDSLFEVFSMLNEQPARLIWYTVILAFLAKFGALVFAFFIRIAFNVGANILTVFMGDKMIVLVENAASAFRLTIPYWCPEAYAILWDRLISIFCGPMAFMPPSYQTVNATMTIASIIMVLVYYGLILLVVSYGMTVWYTGTTCAYLVITKKKDDKDLLAQTEEIVTAQIPEPPPVDK
ncbi:MAG: hypothetical protein KGZ86_08825 [Candidatus Latescibacteria bacterium]|nr:hypothetical protein [Candidatus Latescibacterota bacterium]